MPKHAGRSNGKQHVIFLGAGASATSGFPVGQGLRLLMSSREVFKEKLSATFPPDENAVHANVLTEFDKFEDEVRLFRCGGFGTVDEFSRLAKESRTKVTQAMKRLMRLALCLHNPEEQFHKSDYYPFIQRLFQEQDLSQLKQNVAVLTFNYDCYLDFLLLRAFESRHALGSNARKSNAFMRNKLTSGFFAPDDTAWADQTLNFNYFKLHGSIAFPSRKSTLNYDDLFGPS